MRSRSIIPTMTSIVLAAFLMCAFASASYAAEGKAFTTGAEDAQFATMESAPALGAPSSVKVALKPGTKTVIKNSSSARITPTVVVSWKAPQLTGGLTSLTYTVRHYKDGANRVDMKTVSTSKLSAELPTNRYVQIRANATYGGQTVHSKWVTYQVDEPYDSVRGGYNNRGVFIGYEHRLTGSPTLKSLDTNKYGGNYEEYMQTHAPQSLQLSSPSPGTVKVSWGEPTKGWLGYEGTYYYVNWSYDKNMGWDATTNSTDFKKCSSRRITSASTTSTTISGLQEGRRLYVSVRAYHWDENFSSNRRMSTASTPVKSVLIAETKPLPSSIWTRIWGAKAPDTMQQIAARFGSARTAVVTTSASYKDALAASSLAGRYGAPVLMTSKNSLDAQARASLKKAGVKTVYLVGSTSNVTDKVASQLKSQAGVKTVKRIGGKTPSQRAVAVAKATGKRSDTVIIATQNNYRDALSIAPYSYATKSPILYAETNKKLSTATLNYIKKAGYKKALIIGGPLALPDSVDMQLRSKAGIKMANITRLAGNTCYDTSKTIAEWSNGQLKIGKKASYKGKPMLYVRSQPKVRMGVNKLAVSTGQNWRDALAGAALCGKSKSVMLLADNTGGTHYAQAASFCKANKSRISQAYVLGGKLAVSNKTWNALVTSTMRVSGENTIQ